MVSVKKRVLILAVLVFLIVAGFLGWRWLQRKHAPSDTITLYGNVDIRQVQLAFNDSERIDKLLVDEGSAIHADQLIAQLVQLHVLIVGQLQYPEGDLRKRRKAEMCPGRSDCLFPSFVNLQHLCLPSSDTQRE